MFSSFFIGLRVRKVDLVWGTSPPIFQAFTAWLLARLKGARFLFEVRDLAAVCDCVGVEESDLIVLSNIGMIPLLPGGLVMVNSPGYVDHVGARAASG
jgi:hypothetical protein